MKNNTLTKINYYFWNNINYYFSCFKKQKEYKYVDELNVDKINVNELHDDEKDDLLGVQTIIMYNR